MRPDLLGPGVRVAFPDRTTGVSAPPYDRGNLADHVGDAPSAVAANRAALAHAVGVAPQQLVAMSAQHGADVAIVTVADSARPPEADALVTTQPGCALLVLAADCVPVLLADGAAGVVGVVHAGWRGVRARAVTAGVEVMRAAGATRLRAVVGPAVCGACYRVDEERYADVVAVAPRAAALARGGGLGLDLVAGVLAELADQEVEAVRWAGCTVQDPTWFSHRRDGITGRHGGAVVLAGPGAPRDTPR